MEMMGTRVTIAADQLAHAAAGCLADHVPYGAVDAGDGLEQRLAVAVGHGAGEHLFPDPLGLEDARPITSGASSSLMRRTISGPCSRLSPL